jgi:hypothetical protein
MLFGDGSRAMTGRFKKLAFLGRAPSGLVLFFSVFCVSFLLLLYRSPSPVFFPDFYAEDGKDYLALLRSVPAGGWILGNFLRVAFTPHHGFFLFGNVLLAQLAIGLNALAFHGDAADLPRAMSLVSYGLFAALFGAAAVLLRKRTGLLTVWLTCMALCALPMPRSPELVLGRISNCGLLAFFGAVLICLQRALYTRTRANAVLCDLGFVFCAYSNPMVIVLLPFLYARELRATALTRALRISAVERISAMAVIVCCAINALICLQRGVLSPGASYMESPFVWKSAIEVLLGRSIFYPLIYLVYGHMSNVIVLALAVATGWAVWKCAVRASASDRWWYAAVVFALISSTVLAAIFRPGISVWAWEYDVNKVAHPEFFYVQNYLGILLLALLFQDVARASPPRVRLGITTALGIVIVTMFLSSKSSAAGPWNLYLGTFSQELEQQYWSRSFVDARDHWNRDGRFVQVRTSPFPFLLEPEELKERERAAGGGPVKTYDERWWPVLIPREAAGRSTIRNGGFQGLMSRAAYLAKPDKDFTDAGLQFRPVPPCRLLDAPLRAHATRNVAVPAGACGVARAAAAYSLNITAFPRSAGLHLLAVWPAGQPQPALPILSATGASVAVDTAIVSAGAAGAISVAANEDIQVTIDIDGYFSPPENGTLQFYPLLPCRLLDTRGPNRALGGPAILGGTSRTFPIPSGECGVPATAAAYAWSLTMVPKGDFHNLTAWPAGRLQPAVSTLSGTTLAHAGIVAAGTDGAVTFFASDTIDLVADISGYFAAPSPGGLNFHPAVPCRIVDTRSPSGPFGGPMMAANETRAFQFPAGSCGVPVTAAAYALNFTVTPENLLGYLTAWPADKTLPIASLLYGPKGATTSNTALLSVDPAGWMDVFALAATHVTIDISGYFRR